MEIALLGQFEVRLDGEPIELSSRTQRKLLAYLALHAGQLIPRVKLAGLLWPDFPEAKARKNLRHHIWRLRQALVSENLKTSRSDVSLNARAHLRLDVAILENVPTHADLGKFIKAVSVYAGELLPGYYDDWVQLERERIQAIFERKMRILLNRLAAGARWLELLTWSEHWIAHAQAPEHAYRGLMLGCAGLGDMAGIAFNYWRCKKALEDSLAVEPSAVTLSLFHRLTATDWPGDAEPFYVSRDDITFTESMAPADGTERQFSAGVNLALADLRSGNGRAINWLSHLNRDRRGSNLVSDADPFALISEIRSFIEEHTLTNEVAGRLLQMVSEAFDRESARLPDFLDEDLDQDRRVFVGRQTELRRVSAMLYDVTNKKGRLAFVTGDVGSGKTSLLSAVARHVGDRLPEAYVAWGTCNAFSGPGDPYLPFRKVLSMLMGDVEQPWSDDMISAGQARRLWQDMPRNVDILLNHGPDLLDVIVPARPLRGRLMSAFPDGHPLIGRLEEGTIGQTLPAPVERVQFFEQVAVTLRQLAKGQPLIVLLDDLQWADQRSLQLLFHLSRSLSGARILLLGAYRPVDVVTRDDHPLRLMLAEFRRAFGDIWLDLNEAPGRAFIDAIIDSEPNRLDRAFRDSLFQRTAGHALFTVELLRDMQVRGDLVKDEAGHWMVEPSLDWTALPTRVEGAIESRLNHLDEEWRGILNVAAVEGQTFTAQVIARVQQIPESALRGTLSRELQNRHQLIREEHSEHLSQQAINHYSFAHQMFQQFLYEHLSRAERQILHGRVGNELEELYDADIDDRVVELAHHFDKAGNSVKAATYLLAAGDRARSLYALEEAADYYRRTLKHLHRHHDDERVARTWMRLALTYHHAFDYRRSRRAYDQGFEYWKKVGVSTQAKDGEVTLRLWQPAPASLDPAADGDHDTGIWLKQLYSGLVRISSDNVIVPDVARRWELHDGGRTYVFHLREDAQWSDGHPVTTDDFILAWSQHLNPGYNSHQARLLADIRGAGASHQGQGRDNLPVGLSAGDERTLIIELDRPAHDFLHVLAAPSLFPVPSHALERLGPDWARPQHVVSNGPFKLARWSVEDGVTLVRNPHYHGTFGGNVNRVEAGFLKEEVGWQEGMEQYMRGDLDFLDVSWFPGDVIRAAQKRFGEYYAVLLPYPTTVGLYFDGRQEPVHDPRIRRALAMAIDQEQLVRDLQKDAIIPALGGFVPPGVPGHTPDIGLPYNPDAARRLLAEAGFADGAHFPTLEMTWIDFPNSPEYAGYLSQAWLEELGITIRPVYVPLSELVDMLLQDKRPVIYSIGWTADYRDPDNFLRIGLQDSIRGHRPILSKLRTAEHVREQNRRVGLYQEVDGIVVEEGITIPLFYGSYPVLFGPRVRKLPSDLQWRNFILDPDEPEAS